jgi:1,4-alpha-glucan branching enzyme
MNMAKTTDTDAKKKAAAKKPAAKKAPAKKPVAKKPVAKPAAKQITFLLKAKNATWVSLAGSFNNWNIEAGGMKRNKEGIWEKSVSLKPGRHEYKFVVDGEWWADPDNDN